MGSLFLQYELLQVCQHAIRTCPFSNPVTGADCANQFCNGFPAYIDVGTCVTLHVDQDNCCASNDPAACLQNYAHGKASGGAAATPNVCASIISILDTCFSATPALSPAAMIATSGPSATALASCACYSGGTYDPDTFDGFASECSASGSAIHPTYYPLVTPLLGFCTNNAGAAVQPAASTTPPLAAASTALLTSTTPAAAASTTPPAAAATTVPASSTESVESTTSSGEETTATSAGAGTTSASSSTSSSTSGSTSSIAATPKSGGVKITIQSSAVLLLYLSMLLNF